MTVYLRLLYTVNPSDKRRKNSSGSVRLSSLTQWKSRFPVLPTQAPLVNVLLQSEVRTRLFGCRSPALCWSCRRCRSLLLFIRSYLIPYLLFFLYLKPGFFQEIFYSGSFIRFVYFIIILYQALIRSQHDRVIRSSGSLPHF